MGLGYILHSKFSKCPMHHCSMPASVPASPIWLGGALIHVHFMLWG